jgi:hypothetical protein
VDRTGAGVKRNGDDDWQDELKRELARAGTEFARGLTKEIVARAAKAEQRREELGEARARNRHERRVARKLRRREAAYGRTSPAEGWVYAVAALAVLAVLVTTQIWWLVFIAFGLGAKSARILSFHAERRRETAEVARVVHARTTDPRRARVDETCDRLLEALKDAPAELRAFLSTPDETIGALRRTCHDLLDREQALRLLANPAQAARLVDERQGLTRRIEAETDVVTRQRLASARDALDEQQRQLAEITRQAARLEAEQTRLGYTLDGLYAQVMRMKTAGVSADSGVGLRTSLDQLRTEIGALADSLEEANAAPVHLVDASPPEDLREPPAPGGPSRVRG